MLTILQFPQLWKLQDSQWTIAPTMKLKITDQFLWDLYKLLGKAGNFIDLLLTPRTIHKFSQRLFYNQNPVFDKYRKEMNYREFAKLIFYLKKKGYIKVKNLESKKGFIITKEGLSKALKASFLAEGKQKRNDGKWIMLAYDMPSNNRKARDLMRSILINLGYKMFQQSIWITPYDVYEKTEQLLQLHSLDKYVRIFLIEEI